MDGQVPLIDENDPVQSVFAPVLGLPAWNAALCQGGGLSFEFGNPSLHIREPIEPKAATSPRVIGLLRRRTVKPVGEWNLWIDLCNWRLLARGKEIAHSKSSDRLMRLAASEVDGQRLLSVRVEPDKGTSSFVFDLDATIETWPWEDDLTSQWTLHRRSGHVLGYRSDGRYSWSAEDVRYGEEIWLPLPAPKPA